MKNKGFTLIELLAVIAILAIIMLIATPQVMDVINESKYKALKTNQDSVIKAAQLYMANNIDQLPENIGETIEVTLNQIEIEEYISSISSPFSSNACDGYVLITKITDDNYTYNPQLNCVDNTRTNNLNDGLIGYWKLDNNAYDYSIYNNHGTLNSAEYEVGKENEGILFDGLDYIEISDSSSLRCDTTVALSIWVNTTNYGRMTLLSKYYNEYDFAIEYDTDLSKTELWAWFGDGTNYEGIRLYSNVKIQDGNWHHLVVNLDKSTGEIAWYVDGNFTVDYDLPARTGSGNHSLNIGIRQIAGNDFVGKMDEVRLYNRLLSSEEIKVLYESTK